MAGQVVNFERPPINEVVFGIRLAPKAFLSIHYGLLWEEFRGDFPLASDQAPIFLPDQASSVAERGLMPRGWFESVDGKRLLQLQPDRFHFNWRQRELAEKYPRFEVLLPEFLKVWDRFFRRCREVRPSPEIEIASLELTYLNHFDDRSGWKSPSDNSRVLSFFGLNIPNATLTGSFCQLQYLVEPSIGDLKIGVKQGIRRSDSSPVLVLDLTVSKRFEGESLEKWFVTARDTINSAFVSITTPEAQKLWGRTTGGKK
jgi:uncharacterized protein (TIGR04255 family)